MPANVADDGRDVAVAFGIRCIRAAGRKQEYFSPRPYERRDETMWPLREKETERPGQRESLRAIEMLGRLSVPLCASLSVPPSLPGLLSSSASLLSRLFALGRPRPFSLALPSGLQRTGSPSRPPRAATIRPEAFSTVPPACWP